MCRNQPIQAIPGSGRIVKKAYNPATGGLPETRHFYWSNAWQGQGDRVSGSMDTSVRAGNWSGTADADALKELPWGAEQ